tara:strand:+ start:373 stop:1347 length:975 start_codon:yes stop_codon:yes gene_type:complete
MNKNLSQLDNLIVEILREKNLLNEDNFAASKIDFSKTEKQMSIKLPQFRISEAWGMPGNEDRAIIQKFFNKIEGNTIQQRVQNLNNFINECDQDSCINNIEVPKVLSNLVTLDTLASIIHEFGASPAGFLFEAFLASLVGGTQIVPSASISTEDIINKDGVPVSIKLLQKGGYVKGSYPDLKRAFEEEPWGKKMVYLVVNKIGKADELKLEWYQFPVTQELMDDMLGTYNFADFDPAKPKQFRIKKDYYTQFPIATLDLGSRKNIVEIATRYADRLGDSMFAVYQQLDILGKDVNEYFLEQDKGSAIKATQAADNIKNTIIKDF